MSQLMKDHVFVLAVLIQLWLGAESQSAPNNEKPFCKVYHHLYPYDACFGKCKYYNPKYQENLFEWCDQDRDQNEVLAEDACEECGKCVEDKKNTLGQAELAGGCSPPDATSKPCANEPWKGAGHGGCATYVPDHVLNNFPYCNLDIDSNGVSAADACPECSVCYDSSATQDSISDTGVSGTLIDGGGSSENPSAAPVPPPTLDPYKPICKFYVQQSPFDACFGTCSKYKEGWGPDSNHEYCDQDIDRNEVLAEDACEECGKCVEDKNNNAGQEVLVGGCTLPDSPENQCSSAPWNGNGYGGCVNYAPDHPSNNFFYCSEDKDANGVSAAHACPECGLCYESSENIII